MVPATEYRDSRGRRPGKWTIATNRNTSGNKSREAAFNFASQVDLVEFLFARNRNFPRLRLGATIAWRRRGSRARWRPVRRAQRNGERFAVDARSTRSGRADRKTMRFEALAGYVPVEMSDRESVRSAAGTTITIRDELSGCGWADRREVAGVARWVD
ncbi:hypothetical protein Ari01nite_72800 [Paractinoplanes rishiriensis]|uniref:Uncharacterized protein n=1 Tax=Paractinoplanes rishiriensis TaxID=1050105 RepID=A0A919N0M5_9ACTN|nr:hypothetical protein Ari01nite_72800 [Actinoplanes rishiriensis]